MNMTRLFSKLAWLSLVPMTVWAFPDKRKDASGAAAHPVVRRDTSAPARHADAAPHLRPTRPAEQGASPPPSPAAGASRSSRPPSSVRRVIRREDIVLRTGTPPRPGEEGGLVVSHEPLVDPSNHPAPGETRFAVVAPGRALAPVRAPDGSGHTLQPTRLLEVTKRGGRLVMRPVHNPKLQKFLEGE